MNGVTTNYTLDLNAGLTQVLSDGTNTFVYGNGRIAQVSTTTEYFLGDALGSVRQLTNASGQVTLAKAYTPYGETRSSVGSGTSIYSYTGEQQDASGLTYLRARYYSGNTGRFLTRDTWMGDYNNPLSLNQWNYVNGNPINYTDPSGYSPNCAIKGTCGPDVTGWFMTEMSNHYDYGVGIKNKISRMKALANTLVSNPCTDLFPFLVVVAVEPPFNQIVREFDFPMTNVSVGSTPLLTPKFASLVIDTLGVLEFALYGLAVDYSNVKYKTLDVSCGTGTCATAWKGNSQHDIVSLCGQCRDASDLGNMMFGLGGAARGYSWPFTVGSALLFNKLSGDSTPGWIDGWGAFPGWFIGDRQLFRTNYNQGGFCLMTRLPMGHDNLEQIKGCQACNGEVSNNQYAPSSIVRVSRKGGPNGEATTIEELENKLNGKIDEIFSKLLSR